MFDYRDYKSCSIYLGAENHGCKPLDECEQQALRRMSPSATEGGPTEAKRRWVNIGTTAVKPWGSIFVFILIFLLNLSSPSLFALYGSKDEEMVEDLEKGLRKEEDTQEIETLKRPYLEYNVHNLRDPFEGDLIQKEERQEEKTEKEIEVSEKPPSLSVKGLVWGGTIPQAIINDKVVKIGDVIEEAEIIEIGKEGVTVLYKNQIYKLSSPASNYMSTGKEQADNLQ